METVTLVTFFGGLVVVEVTYEAPDGNIRRIAARNDSDRPLIGYARRADGEWDRYDLAPGQNVDRAIPGNRRVPMSELMWHAALGEPVGD